MSKMNRETKVDEWLTDDGLMLIEAWARDGHTRLQIAENIGISPQTLSGWARDYEEIGKALRTGREIVDYKVENALLKSALGFKTKEIKVTIGRQVVNGVAVNIIKETTTKEIAPSVTACLAWLNNRRPDKWKRNRDNVIDMEDEDNGLQITIVRGSKTDDNKDLENVNKEVQFTKNPNSENKKQFGENEQNESDIVIEQDEITDIDNYMGSFSFLETFPELFYKAMRKKINPLILFKDGGKLKSEKAESYLNKNNAEQNNTEYLIFRYKETEGYTITNSLNKKEIVIPNDILDLEYEDFLSEVQKLN